MKYDEFDRNRELPLKISLVCAFILCGLLTGVASAEFPAYGNWTEITSDAGFNSRVNYGVAVFDNRLWVIGGIDDHGNYKNDVWSSPDGKNWTVETEHAAFSPRGYFGVPVFDDRLWVIGGASNNGLLNDVWSSRDGKNWTLETEHAAFSPRGYSGVIIFEDRLWITGGLSNDSPTTFFMTNDVWSSRNGKNWTLEAEHANFDPRYGFGITVFDGHLWVIGGSTNNALLNDVWSSKDGKYWKQINSSAPFKQMEFTPVATFENKLWIIGGGSNSPPVTTKNAPVNDYNEIWSSPDGNIWTMETEHAGFSPRFLHGVAVFRNGIWVIGGEGSNGKDVWYMPLRNPSPVTAPVASAAPERPRNTTRTITIVENDTGPGPHTPTPTRSGIDGLLPILALAAGFLGIVWRTRG